MPTLTLAQLRSRVYERLENNTAFYTAAQVNSAINEAARITNLMTGFVMASATVAAVAGTYRYSTPATIAIPTRVMIGSRALHKTTLHHLGMESRHWTTETEDLTGRSVEEWLPLGVNSFAVHPVPSSVRNFTVTGVANITPLSSDGSALVIPSELGDLIEEYAAHMVQIKAGGAVARAAMIAYKNFMKRIHDVRRYKQKIHPHLRLEVEVRD